MTRTFVARLALASVVALALVAVPAPALAQTGALTGKVVDEAGKPVPDCDMSFDYAGDLNLHFTGKTNAKGEWVRAGLMTAGRWTITAKKGPLVGRATQVSVPFGGSQAIPDIVIKAGAALATPVNNSEAEAQRAKQLEMQKFIADVNTALASNDYDTALAKLTEATTKIDKCATCYVRMGDIYVKKAAAIDDADKKKAGLDDAEKAYLKAAELDATSADPYDSLAALYNQEKKFTEATQMSEKASALHSTGGGGGDATSEYNAGAIAFNQSPPKIAEAKTHFQKAIALNPGMAEAHFQLAMCFINEGNVVDAKKSLQQYLTLAPTGPNAATAKAIIDMK